MPAKARPWKERPSLLHEQQLHALSSMQQNAISFHCIFPTLHWTRAAVPTQTKNRKINLAIGLVLCLVQKQLLTES